MASRFFQCICGDFAIINMWDWMYGRKEIRCDCGRSLDADKGVFGFTLNSAKYAWRKYMKEEVTDNDKRKQEI